VSLSQPDFQPPMVRGGFLLCIFIPCRVRSPFPPQAPRLSPFASPLCACVCVHTRAVELLKTLLTNGLVWCSAVSNSIVYSDKNYICQQKKNTSRSSRNPLKWANLGGGCVTDFCMGLSHPEEFLHLTGEQPVQSQWQKNPQPLRKKLFEFGISSCIS